MSTQYFGGSLSQNSFPLYHTQTNSQSLSLKVAWPVE